LPYRTKYSKSDMSHGIRNLLNSLVDATMEAHQKMLCFDYTYRFCVDKEPKLDSELWNQKIF
jgi:hypothetical protein